MTTTATPLFDLHCHLDLFPNPAVAFEECRASKVVTLTVTTTPRAWPQNRQWAKGNPFVLPALGLHPELVDSHGGEIDQMLNLMKGVAIIGETGLDGSPKYRSSYETQLRVFKRIVAASAQEPGRILSIHSRSAAKDVLSILQPHAHDLQPILHWFLGTPAQVKAAVELGCYFSVNGSMLKSQAGQAVIAAVPLDRLLIESDAPFRQEAGLPSGRINDVRLTISGLGELKRMEAANLNEHIGRNSMRILGVQYR
jgi:TatD DNase family protein